MVPLAREGYSVAVTLLSDLEHSYSPQEERPLRGYLGVMGAYGSVVAGLGFALRRRTLPDRLGIQDIGQVALATHKLSRLITKAPITSPRRAPPRLVTSLYSALAVADLLQFARARAASGTS